MIHIKIILWMSIGLIGAIAIPCAPFTGMGDLWTLFVWLVAAPSLIVTSHREVRRLLQQRQRVVVVYVVNAVTGGRNN